MVKLIKNNNQYKITLPIEKIKNLKWKKGDMLTVNQVGDKLIVAKIG